MDKLEIVKKAVNIETPPEEASQYYDEAFQSTDAVGSPPLDLATWFGMGDLLRAAFPDIDYVVEDVHKEGEEVVMKGHWVGTFTNELDLSVMGVGKIPATGKKVRWPTGIGRISFKGDKIIRFHSPDTGPDAGLPGFLRPLGVEM